MSLENNDNIADLNNDNTSDLNTDINLQNIEQIASAPGALERLNHILDHNIHDDRINVLYNDYCLNANKLETSFASYITSSKTKQANKTPDVMVKDLLNAATGVNTIKNIGIVAHIDAGKTTTTERLLYYTGKIKSIGEVHDGATTTDWMEQEKARGITITSAAVTCNWNFNSTNYTINVIDTPGHVDFTIEVERSLRVLDGAVLLLESVSGTQPQTLTVNKQIRRYKVPCIICVNKMDRLGANFPKCITDIRDKLGFIPLVVHIPVGSAADFTGIINVVQMKYYKWSGVLGEKYTIHSIPEDMLEEAQQQRAALLENIITFANEELMNEYLENQDISEDNINKLIKKAVLSHEAAVVLACSSYKNVGIETLLDSIIQYLPSPLERGEVKAILCKNNTPIQLNPISAPLSVLVFKIARDPYGGRLCYIKVVSGVLRKGMKVFVTRTNSFINVGRLVKMLANTKFEVDTLHVGDIAALLGDLEVITGDTLCDAECKVLLEKLYIPEPVISISVAPKSKNDQDKLVKALKMMEREDPSLHFTIDAETNEMMLSGMGELHLEIKVDLLRTDYGIVVIVGNPNVAYRETITDTAEINYTHKKQTGGAGQFGRIYMKVEPMNWKDFDTENRFEFENKVFGGHIPSEYMPAIQKGITLTSMSGFLIKAPVLGFKTVIMDGATHPVDSSSLAFEMCAKYSWIEMMKNLYAAGKLVVLEPIMLVNVYVPSEYMGVVVGDISSRRGVLETTEDENNYKKIVCYIPFAEIIGYIKTLRELTKGQGSYDATLHSYEKLPGHLLEALRKTKGVL